MNAPALSFRERLNKWLYTIDEDRLPYLTEEQIVDAAERIHNEILSELKVVTHA